MFRIKYFWYDRRLSLGVHAAVLFVFLIAIVLQGTGI